MVRYIRSSRDDIKLYRVEFKNPKVGVWEVLDETMEVEGFDELDAIKEVKKWWIETADDPEMGAAEIEDFQWVASEILGTEDEYGVPEFGDPVFSD